MKSRLFQTIVVVGASLTAGCAANPITPGSVLDGGASDLGDLAWPFIDASWPIIAVDLGRDLTWPTIDIGWPTIMVPRDMTRVDSGD